MDEARKIYDARRVVEAGIVVKLTDSLSDRDIAALEAHVAEEARAVEAGDRPASIRLSGAFHLRLAEMTGSDLIGRQMQELVSRTAMLVAFYEHGSLSGCACSEHASIVSALKGRETMGAVRAMTSHLSLIETRLRPASQSEDGRDLEELLRVEIARLLVEETGVETAKSRFSAEEV
nr:FCD domain-containing protein [Martelella sp. HB161492]